MQNLKFLFVKSRLHAYINGELSPLMRRYIARQIDQDPRCYREYRQQRTIKETFEHQLAFMPKPTHARMDAMWMNIQQEMTTTSSRSAPLKPLSIITYATLTLLIVLFVIIPLNWRIPEGNLLAPPSQPSPHVMFLSVTPTADKLTLSSNQQIVAQIAITQNTLPQLINEALANTPSATLPQS